METTKFNNYWQRAQSTIYSEPAEGNFHTGLIPGLVADYLKAHDTAINARILDVGCGQGVFLAEMEKRGYDNVTGITLSQEDKDYCEKKNYKVDVVDFSDLPYEDGSVDLIWCRHALEHSPAPLFTLYEFERVLKTGGKVYIEVPTPEDTRLHETNPNHYSILGRTMWLSLFTKAGFNIAFQTNVTLSLMQDLKPIKETYYIFIIQKNGNGYSQIGASANH